MLLLPNGSFDKPPSRLAALATRRLIPIALTLHNKNTKAGCLLLSRVDSEWSTFPLMPPVYLAHLASHMLEVIRGESRLGVCAVVGSRSRRPQ